MLKQFDLNSEKNVRITTKDRKIYIPRVIVEEPSDELMNKKSDIYTTSTIQLTFLKDEFLYEQDIRKTESKLSVSDTKDYMYTYQGKRYEAIDVFLNGSYENLLHIVCNVYGG